MSDESRGQPPPIWCIVANVIRERPYGPGGQEIRRGTKHFAPGAKVYVLGFFWGSGDDLTVVGHHRRSNRYITLSMTSHHLVNWRVELVYSPHVIDAFKQHQFTYTGYTNKVPDNYIQWLGSPEGKARAEDIIRWLHSFDHPTVDEAQPHTTRPPTDQASREQADKG